MSRVDDYEMAERHPKLRIKEFLRHTLVSLFKALPEAMP